MTPYFNNSRLCNLNTVGKMNDMRSLALFKRHSPSLGFPLKKCRTFGYILPQRAAEGAVVTGSE